MSATIFVVFEQNPAWKSLFKMVELSQDKRLYYFERNLSYDVTYCVNIIHTLPNLEKNLYTPSAWWNR